MIDVAVVSKHLPEHPVAGEGKFAFVYFVTITNHFDQPMQLLNRYWLITDGNGKQTEVRGPGVVGNQPLIQPGESYEYNSGAILDTPVGSMQGFYEMQDPHGKAFEAPINVFSLRAEKFLN